MITALKFAQGAIKKNGVAPELEHYTIKDGRVTGFNGYMALSAPLQLDIEAMPHASQFFKALAACGETVAITKTPAGRLHIKSGGFSAYVPCLEKVVFDAVPTGVEYGAPPGLAAAFTRLLPFISDDASRPWAMGLSIGNGSYTATNNVVLIQVWGGHSLPQINCPRFAVAEVARIRRDPVKLMVDKHSLSFIYEDGSWLRTQLLEQDWPLDRMSQIMDREVVYHPIPEGFYEALERLAPFIEATGPVFFSDKGMATVQDVVEEGVALEFPGLPKAAFRHKALAMLQDEMTSVDWDSFPNAPCLFRGADCRGAIIGMSF